MYRSNSQKSAQRPYSVNNPFRNASRDSSLNQYETDQDFQNWVAQNARTAPYIASGGRNASSVSFTDSIEEHPEEANENYFHDNVVAIPARKTLSRASYGSRESYRYVYHLKRHASAIRPCDAHSFLMLYD